MKVIYGNRLYDLLDEPGLLVMSGQRASGKSTITRQIVAAAATGDIKGAFSIKACKVALIDTEQGKKTAQRAKQEIYSLGVKENLKYFRITGEGSQEAKWEKLCEIISEGDFDLVVIDNMSGLISNPNDQTMSNTIVTKLLHFAELKEIKFVLISHTNSEGGSFGALGTVLENNASNIMKLFLNNRKGYTLVRNEKNRADDLVPDFDFSIIDGEFVIGPHNPFPKH